MPASDSIWNILLLHLNFGRGEIMVRLMPSKFGFKRDASWDFESILDLFTYNEDLSWVFRYTPLRATEGTSSWKRKSYILSITVLKLRQGQQVAIMDSMHSMNFFPRYRPCVMLRIYVRNYRFACIFNSLSVWKCGCNITSSSCEIVLRWMPQNTFEGKSVSVRVMARCRQTTNHYLSWCCSRSIYIYRCSAMG